MFAAGHYRFGGCLLTVFLSTLACDLATGNLRALPGEVRETLLRGVCTPRLLDAMERERGFEAFLALGITAYSVPFVFTSARSTVTGYASMGLSLWGLGTHVYEALDLSMLEATE